MDEVDKLSNGVHTMGYEPLHKLQVLIIESSPLLRYCVESVLECQFGISVEIVGVATNLNEARDILIRVQVDVLISSPVSFRENMGGWQKFCLLVDDLWPHLVLVIMIDFHVELMRIFTHEKLRTRTIILKNNVSIDKFCYVISLLKRKIIPRELTLASKTFDRVPVAKLTRKESMVLVELMKGISLQQICHRNGDNMKTLSCHKRKAMKKLGLKNNIHLLLFLQSQRMNCIGLLDDVIYYDT